MSKYSVTVQIFSITPRDYNRFLAIWYKHCERLDNQPIMANKKKLNGFVNDNLHIPGV